MRKVTAQLEQLSCPDCASMIEQVVTRQKGVSEAKVRYTTSKLIVSFDPEITDFATISKAVAKLGYKVLKEL